MRIELLHTLRSGSSYHRGRFESPLFGNGPVPNRSIVCGSYVNRKKLSRYSAIWKSGLPAGTGCSQRNRIIVCIACRFEESVMAIEFACPSCGGTLRVEDDAVGQVVRCGGCMTMLRVPDVAADALSSPIRPILRFPMPLRRHSRIRDRHHPLLRARPPRLQNRRRSLFRRMAAPGNNLAQRGGGVRSGPRRPRLQVEAPSFGC